MSKSHELQTAVLAYPCWAVYADYGGNAPDTADIVFCASEELAKELCLVLQRVDPNADDGEDDAYVWYPDDVMWRDGSLPYIEGYHASRTFCWRETLLAEPTEIRKTIEQCLEALDFIKED